MTDLLAETKLAIELEQKGCDFYCATAGKTKNPLAASTLGGLAKRELLHIKRIKEFYHNLTGEQKLAASWLAGVEVPPAKAELLKPILDNLKNNLDRKFETQKDITEAYQIAEGLERDSYTLYEKIAKESTDEMAGKFYSALAQEEREHYAILDDTLLYLNDPGEWYRLQEKWIVEGG